MLTLTAEQFYLGKQLVLSSFNSRVYSGIFSDGMLIVHGDGQKESLQTRLFDDHFFYGQADEMLQLHGQYIVSSFVERAQFTELV